MSDNEYKLQDWVINNWCTQGYGLSFEKLDLQQLERLSELIQKVKEDKGE